MGARKFLTLCREAYAEWNEDKAARLGAALAYYAVFSLAPLLILLLWLLGFALGEVQTEERLRLGMNGLLGAETGAALSDFVRDAAQSDSRPAASTTGLIILFIGATGVFCQLQDALDTVWEVRPIKKFNPLSVVIERWLSLVMVLGIGFLLLLSLVLSAALTFLASYAEASIPFHGIILELLHNVVALVVTCVLFALMYKILPNVHVPWRSVWPGALLASVGFTVGKVLLSLYLGMSSLSSSYGAAGSLIVILLWTYYSAQILLFGAEFTQVYARQFGIAMRAKDGYEMVIKRERE